MTDDEQPYKGTSVEQAVAGIEPPEFRETMAGVTMTVAAGRLHEIGQHFDPAEFEALIAVHRPELWRRMNKRPGRLRGILRRVGRRR